MLAETPRPIREETSDSTSTHTEHAINSYDQLRSYWRHYAGKAHVLHKSGKVKQAARLFTQCIAIAKCLLHTTSQNKDHSGQEQSSGIALHYFASHNLAACLNQLELGTRAEHTLRHTYQTIIDLCEAPSIKYEVKLDALSILDKSLFSLTSQLAYLGKVDQIHTLIMQTDHFAETTTQRLDFISKTERESTNIKG